MGRRIPDRPLRLGSGIVGGQADIAQQVRVQPPQVVALAEQRIPQKQAREQRPCWSLGRRAVAGVGQERHYITVHYGSGFLHLMP